MSTIGEYLLDADIEEMRQAKKRAKPAKHCGNPECATSTGICGATTHGRGDLCHNGYWSRPCYICARHYEDKPDEDWPYSQVHVTHCCVVHGCKYSESTCPVVNQQERQTGGCESCSDDTILDPKHRDFDIEFMGDGQMRAEIVRLRDLVEQARQSVRV